MIKSKSPIAIIALSLVAFLAGCDDPGAEEFRSTRRVEVRETGVPLDCQAPAQAQILCCSNPGGCSEPAPDGSCPDGTVHTCCADEETCSGEACWYECGPQHCLPNS